VSDKYPKITNAVSPKFVKLMDYFIRFLEISLRFSINKIDNIPVSGPGILIMNHSAIPLDGMLLISIFLKQKKRMIRPLISKNLRKHLFLRESVMLWGGVDANAANALKLLRNGELLLIYPGGPKEAIKDDREKYRLIWEGEYGFIKLALLTGAPIIPIAAIGLDENFHLISQGTFINEILFGPDAFLLPIVRPRHIIPRKVTLYVGNPITLSYPPQAVKDKELLSGLQQEIKGIMEEMISRQLAKSSSG
jgi:1-acyl-sn-glycerol-3-phosphate acyltransferase